MSKFFGWVQIILVRFKLDFSGQIIHSWQRNCQSINNPLFFEQAKNDFVQKYFVITNILVVPNSFMASKPPKFCDLHISKIWAKPRVYPLNTTFIFHDNLIRDGRRSDYLGRQIVLYNRKHYFGLGPIPKLHFTCFVHFLTTQINILWTLEGF